ncbi:MAG: hypothetical protein E2585_15435 [Comamonas sp.]|uniref:hypothetical protein n=1 Tax=Comamonas sp. TaxID=34028 RepID=UPI0012C6C371|nr:hypothetical protein [Comamonas sp.]MPS90058.1 hypothetical protein [Comamonas sp.]
MAKRGMRRGQLGWPDEWAFWHHVENYKKTNKLRSLERAALARLHCHNTLDYLAYRVATAYADAGIPVRAAVESVWIDGTPQASGTTVSGKTVNCELADLLYLVDERDLANKLVTRRGLLLQGKLANQQDVLLGGPSTTKERNLLECLDTRAALELYRDTKRTNRIGSYQFKPGASSNYAGMEDCARYLMMPKSLSQWRKLCLFSPLSVGWPRRRTEVKLGSVRRLSQVIEDMGLAATQGKPVIAPSACEWSRMVYDLLGKYEKPPSLLGGPPLPVPHAYAGHRIHRSHIHHYSSFLSLMDADMPPISPFTTVLYEDEPPGISFVRLTVYREVDHIRG